MNLLALQVGILVCNSQGTPQQKPVDSASFGISYWYGCLAERCSCWFGGLAEANSTYRNASDRTYFTVFQFIIRSSKLLRDRNGVSPEGKCECVIFINNVSWVLYVGHNFTQNYQAATLCKRASHTKYVCSTILIEVHTQGFHYWF